MYPLHRLSGCLSDKSDIKRPGFYFEVIYTEKRILLPHYNYILMKSEDNCNTKEWKLKKENRTCNYCT